MTKKHKDSSDITRAQIRQLGARLVARHRNFYAYTFFGFLAALINIVSFILFHSWWKIPLIYANTLSFIVSNLVSFVFNKHGVFVENVDTRHGTIYQLGLFFLYRILSLIPDNLIMLVGLSWLHWNTLFVKTIDQILVGIFNYLTTKSIFLNTSSRFTKYFKNKRAKNKIK
ncbi:GtrA family protein [Lactobacillus sp. PV012]|uniref:GtrA family protein n=1 Tax=Lactobacillus sp. PV012 TaxID=2594494 RepID=UPI00224059D7|nr:GtrA family protein [Lactobacillus sp. PV012]QNQ82611.1 GtrA family protein [Lactobacillus sp. PV012]